MPSIFFRLPIRIYAVVAMALALSVLLTVLLLSRAVDNAYAMRDRELNNIIDTSISLLADLEAQVQSGDLTADEARAQGREVIEKIRFETSGYLFAFDQNLVVRAHPMVPDWVGTDRSGFEDVKGMKVFQELGKVAASDGAGSVRYWFQKPGQTTPEQKIGYVQAFEPWGWIIGTGSYVSDIQADLAQMRIESMITLGVSLVLLMIASTVLLRSVTGPINGLKARMASMAEGETHADVPYTQARSEIGEMARTLEAFREKLEQQEEMKGHQQARDAERADVVQVISSRLATLSQGDLTVRINENLPEDYAQLQRDFNRTAETLGSTVTQVIDTAESIRSGANEISQASDDLSNRTESQAATLEETAAALDEMTASVKSAAEGARSVESIMQEAKQEAETSGEVVQSAVSAMTEIEQSSSHISQIISVIDDIAFQTNLLALNAGVEAARAGEAGKGFAVVASEVRALAQRSSDAAMEIKTLIGDSTKQVERGVDLVGKTGDALQGIVERVSHISQLVSGIATGASEQSTGLHEINTGVTQLDQVTQQNAAMVEEATAAGHMLNADASKLADLVAHFRVAAGGGQTAAPARKPAAAPAPTRSPVAPQDATPSAPSAHGDDWDLEAVTPQPAPAVASTSGNAAKDIWQDF
ncbi:methyl-accepting chemotaxis sensory transducer with Cache sensor [Phaeobacter piscinae]|uniref:Methyl-accepting chemotaxis sensory transducer with Cache sensor n=1 Tax=Phaeobacter piscinae TaxID=1580596 RepID=A0AAN1L9Q7_9RHOB|nr:methyl-accepting chemotaxis protein [Phaeobacter piscinae]ATG42783.1 methyl-accepting chemotaxis sensory transducer with Cache sensor [Phaeobacter piscinae]AUR35101.1 methyl-accepting chemotaxis sensory transducer with Cache sensor [Phaeobacter piscinae]